MLPWSPHRSRHGLFEQPQQVPTPSAAIWHHSVTVFAGHTLWRRRPAASRHVRQRAHAGRAGQPPLKRMPCSTAPRSRPQQPPPQVPRLAASSSARCRGLWAAAWRRWRPLPWQPFQSCRHPQVGSYTPPAEISACLPSSHSTLARQARVHCRCSPCQMWSRQHCPAAVQCHGGQESEALHTTSHTVYSQMHHALPDNPVLTEALLQHTRCLLLLPWHDLHKL